MTRTHHPDAGHGDQPNNKHGHTAGSRCEGQCVGVLVTDEYGRILIGDRVDGAGAAPVAGHVYPDPGPQQAAYDEVHEVMGLTVTSLTYITSGWRADRCHRGDGPDGPGHLWHIYRARATGELSVYPGSYTGVRWATTTELRRLTARTAAYARGQVQPAEWVTAPGIEPVWVLWLDKADLLPVSRQNLDAIEDTLPTGNVAATATVGDTTNQEIKP